MAKKLLTLKDLELAGSLEDLPTLQPLHAEVTRLTDEDVALSAAVSDAGQRLRNPSQRPDTADEFDRLTTLARDGQRRLTRLRYELADVQKKVKEETVRTQEAVDALLLPQMAATIKRLMAALETATPIDKELRALEQTRNKFVPNFYAVSHALNLSDQLAQCVRYLESQRAS